jgi:O-antigen/teichoic acid export membrane protein
MVAVDGFQNPGKDHSRSFERDWGRVVSANELTSWDGNLNALGLRVAESASRGILEAACARKVPVPEPGILVAKLAPWAKKGGLAVLDHALFAGTNFFINVLLARWLTPTEYGAYALAFSVFVLFSSIYMALWTEPMMVFGSGKYAGHFEEYLGTLLLGHVYSVLPVVLILLGAAYLVGFVYSVRAEHALFGLAIAAPFILLLWLVRRAFYVRLRPGWATVGGGLYFVLLPALVLALKMGNRLSPVSAFLGMGVLAAVITLLLLIRLNPSQVAAGAFFYLLFLLALIYPLWTGKQLSPVAVCLGMGVATLTVSAFLLLRLRPRWKGKEGPTLGMAAGDHWRYGRWSLASGVVGWFPDNVFYLLLPAWIGLQGSGALRALVNLANPGVQTIGALSSILLPMLVRDRRKGGARAMHRKMFFFLVLFLAGAGLYFVLLWGFRSQIVRLVYAGKYQQYTTWPLLLAGLIPCGSSVSAVLGNALRALERPDRLFWCYLGSAIAAAGSIPLALEFGLTGALAGLLIADLAKVLLMAIFYKKALRQERAR